MVDSNSDGGPQFAEVFVVVWVGALVVTVNSKLLGGTMYVKTIKYNKIIVDLSALKELCHDILSRFLQHANSPSA